VTHAGNNYRLWSGKIDQFPIQAIAKFQMLIRLIAACKRAETRRKYSNIFAGPKEHF